MRYTDEQIREQLLWFVDHLGQREIRWVIPYCIGFYGCVTQQIWKVIGELLKEEVLTW